jgi:hypothetical protein
VGTLGAAIELRSRLQDVDLERRAARGGRDGDGWEEVGGSWVRKGVGHATPGGGVILHSLKHLHELMKRRGPLTPGGCHQIGHVDRTGGCRRQLVVLLTVRPTRVVTPGGYHSTRVSLLGGVTWTIPAAIINIVCCQCLRCKIT